MRSRSFLLLAAAVACGVTLSAETPAPAVKSAAPLPAAEVRGEPYRPIDRAIREGDLAAAEGLLAPLLAAKPGDPVALVQQARIRIAQQKMSDAETILTNLTKTAGPAAGEAFGELALLRFMQGRAADAAENVKQALALTPDQPDALVAQAHLDLQAKQVDRASDALMRAIAVRPEFDEAYGGRAVVLVQQGKIPEAITLLQDRLKQNPQSLVLHFQMIQLYLHLGQLPKAREEVTRISQLKHPMAASAAANLDLVVKRLELRAMMLAHPPAPTTPGAGAPAATPVAPAKPKPN